MQSDKNHKCISSTKPLLDKKILEAICLSRESTEYPCASHDDVIMFGCRVMIKQNAVIAFSSLGVFKRVCTNLP